MTKYVLVLLLIPLGLWGQDRETMEALAQLHFLNGDLVAVGSVPVSDWDPAGSQVPQVDYEILSTGGYQDKVVEVDCIPFFVQRLQSGAVRYWAYGTDDTGFGWFEDQPIILVSTEVLEASEPRGQLNALTVPTGLEEAVLYDRDAGGSVTRKVPVLSVVSHR